MSLSTPLPLRCSEGDIALALGGGGAKGSYEIGVFDALSLLGIRAGSAYGISVGALNAALYAQGAFGEAEALWARLQVSDIVSEEILKEADRLESVLSRPDRLMEAIAKYGRQKGLDVTPLKSLIHRYAREDRLRASPVRFGLGAARISNLSLEEKTVGEMAEGSLCDWLLASCACFPAFPLQEIDGEMYADGGFCDNVPVGMALRRGARHVIAVDIGKRRAHTRYDKRPDVTYIRASRPLGTLLGFDPEQAAFNRGIGRNDTLRAFRALAGYSYSFDPRSAAACAGDARDLVETLSRLEAIMTPERAVRLHSPEAAPLFGPLEEGMTENADGEIGYWLRGCELCCECLLLSPLPVYTMASLREALLSALPRKEARVLSGRIPESAAALFAKPRLSRALAVAALAFQIEKNGASAPLMLRSAESFPKEFLTALMLTRLLPGAWEGA